MRGPISDFLDELEITLKGRESYKRDALSEIEDHLREAATSELASGALDPQMAEHIAVTRFGPPLAISRGLSEPATPAHTLLAIAVALATVAVLAVSGGWQAASHSEPGTSVGWAEPVPRAPPTGLAQN